MTAVDPLVGCGVPMEPSNRRITPALATTADSKRNWALPSLLRGIPSVYTISLFSIVAVVVGFIWYDLHGAYHDTLAYWDARLSSSAVERVSFATLWLNERRTDTVAIAENALSARLLSTASNRSELTETRQGVEQAIERMARINGFLGGAVADTECRIAAQSGMPAEALAGVQESCRQAQSAGDFRVFIHAVQPAHVWLDLAYPVFAGGETSSPGQTSRRELGAAVMITEPWKSALPFLSSESGFQGATETLIVWKNGHDAVLFCPRLAVQGVESVFRRPLSEPTLESRAAREDTIEFGGFTDYRGVRVFGAAQSVGPADASLVRKVDRYEALQEYHRRAVLEGMAGTLALLLSGFVMSTQHRRVATRELKEKVRRQHELLELKQLAEVSEERFRVFLESLNAIVWEADASAWQFTFVSQRAQEILGYPVEQWLSEPNFWANHIYPDDREQAVWICRTATAKGEDHTFEYRAVAADGRIVWLRDIVRVFKGDVGKPVRLRGIMVDTTELKRAEEELRRNKDELQRVMASIPDYLWSGEVNSQGNWTYRYYSSAVEKITGRSAEFYLQGPDAWLSTVHPEDRPRMLRSFEKLRAGQSDGDETEYRIVRPDGTIRWVRDCARVRMVDAGIRIDGVVSDITERKRAEEALRHSEQRYKDFISHSNEGVWRLELEQPIPVDLPVEESVQRLLQCGYFAECNLAYARNLGFSTLEEIVGRRLGDLVPSLDAGRMESFRSAARGGWQSRTVEYRGLDHAGSARYWLRTEIPIIENGMLVRVWGITRDLTDLKRAEEELRNSEERWRAVFENSAVGIALSDPISTRFRAANLALQSMLGYSEDELRGLSFMDITHQDDREANRRLLAELLDGRRPSFTMQKRYLRKDGNFIWANIHVSAVPGSLSISRFSMAIIEDITERKQAEESLRESEERFRTTFENAGVGMALVDMQGHPVKSNPALLQMLGYTEEELSRMACTEFTHPDHRELNWALYSELAAGKSDKYEIETRYLKKGGGVIWGLLTVSLVKDPHGRPMYAIGMVEDITARKQAQVELHRSFAQLRALAARLQSVREEERKRVAREIHDQLGQALTAIKIDLSAVVCDKQGDLEQRSKKTSSILRLVDETIQSVRRISTELRPGMLDDLGLAATVEWAGEEFEARTGTKFHLDLPQGDISIDPERATAVFRIFQETLTNVARHADAREIKVRLAKDDGHLILEVYDDGKGIPDDKLSNGGSLGILGMRERAVLLGGDLTIVGIPGKGTTVTVRIPEANRP